MQLQSSPAEIEIRADVDGRMHDLAHATSAVAGGGSRFRDGAFHCAPLGLHTFKSASYYSSRITLAAVRDDSGDAFGGMAIPEWDGGTFFSLAGQDAVNFDLHSSDITTHQQVCS